METDEKFWQKVEKTSTCWLWNGELKDGYGRFNVGDEHIVAHRYSWEQLKGPIPTGLQIDHLCSFKNCVNPNHMELVTQQENLRRNIDRHTTGASSIHPSRSDLRGNPGWWSTHEYRRHSVQEVDEFVGWGKLKEICEAGHSLRNRALPAALFLTGTRISEAIQLRKAHFDFEDGTWVRCSEVPLVKQKVAKPFRTFSFLKAEPLWPYLKEYLEAPVFALKSNQLLFPIGANMAYKIVTELGKQAGITIWNHWFRSQRASQMGAEYNMTENDMLEWFKVKDRNWARRYCKKGDWGLRKVLLENKPEEWHN